MTVALAHSPNVEVHPLAELAVIRLHLVCGEYSGMVTLGITPRGIEFFTGEILKNGN